MFAGSVVCPVSSTASNLVRSAKWSAPGSTPCGRPEADGSFRTMMTFHDPYSQQPVSGGPYPQQPISGGPYPHTPHTGPPYPATPAVPVSPVVAVGAPMYLVQQKPTSGMAVASMVLGTVGLLLGCCAFGIPSILAVIMGHAAMGETRSGAKGGHGMAVAGLILGYVVVLPAIIFSVWVVLMGGLGAITGGGSSSY